MRALTFWKTVTVDEADLLEQFLTVLEKNAIAFCVVGGQAVNAYVEPYPRLRGKVPEDVLARLL